MRFEAVAADIAAKEAAGCKAKEPVCTENQAAPPGRLCPATNHIKDLDQAGGTEGVAA